MAHTIGWTGSQADLFNELGSGGGAILFVDNIDQIDDPAEWETVSDLLSEAVRSPGWRVVVTGELGNDGWKTKLPGAARASGAPWSSPRSSSSKFENPGRAPVRAGAKVDARQREGQDAKNVKKHTTGSRRTRPPGAPAPRNGVRSEPDREAAFAGP